MCYKNKCVYLINYKTKNIIKIIYLIKNKIIFI